MHNKENQLFIAIVAIFIDREHHNLALAASGVDVVYCLCFDVSIAVVVQFSMVVCFVTAVNVVVVVSVCGATAAAANA